MSTPSFGIHWSLLTLGNRWHNSSNSCFQHKHRVLTARLDWLLEGRCCRCASRLHTFFPAIGGTGRNLPFSTYADFLHQFCFWSAYFNHSALFSTCAKTISLGKQEQAKFSWRHSDLATEGRTSSGDTAMIPWWLITWSILLHTQLNRTNLKFCSPFLMSQI